MRPAIEREREARSGSLGYEKLLINRVANRAIPCRFAGMALLQGFHYSQYCATFFTAYPQVSCSCVLQNLDLHPSRSVIHIRQTQDFGQMTQCSGIDHLHQVPGEKGRSGYLPGYVPAPCPCPRQYAPCSRSARCFPSWLNVPPHPTSSLRCWFLMARRKEVPCFNAKHLLSLNIKRLLFRQRYLGLPSKGNQLHRL